MIAEAPGGADQQELVEIRTLNDALALLNRWEAAYAKLEREAAYYAAIIRARDAQREKA